MTLRLIEHMHTDGAVFANGLGELWVYCAVCKRPFRMLGKEKVRDADQG